MNERRFIVKLNAFESGVLLGMIDNPKNAKQKEVLDEVMVQLIEHAKIMREEAGVTVMHLPNGLLQLQDRDGNTIVREPYEWEKEET